MACYVNDGDPIPLAGERELIFERAIGTLSVIIENTGYGPLRIGSEKVEQTTGFGLPSDGRLRMTLPDIPDKLYAIAEDPDAENSVLVTSTVMSSEAIDAMIQRDALAQ